MREKDINWRLLWLLLVSTGLMEACGFQVARYSVKRTVVAATSNVENDDSNIGPAAAVPRQVKPDILEPFLPAVSEDYMNVGPVGEEEFQLSRSGEPTLQELSNENLLKILLIRCSDLEVNTLVWKCLGYRYDEVSKRWNNDKCFPNWRKNYPSPPDLIGMQRIYTAEVDKPSLKANQALVRSVPVESKQSLKTHLRPLGFTGYQYAELTPNKTRRAQCANWLLYYREELFGRSVEELREKRRLKKAADEAAKQDDDTDEWKPPVKEVF